jgi:basic amino acid/polyamine antiporter, APA family
VSRRRRVQGWLLARDLSISGACVLFSMWVTFAAGFAAVYQALVAIMAGLIIYPFLKARRERLGQVPEPTDTPPDQEPGQLPAAA